MSGWIKWSIAGLIAVGVGIGFYLYWQHEARYPSTDDAYVQAHVVHIAPEVTARVEQVLVRDYQQVRRGEVLLRLDRRPFVIALEKAKAKLDETQQQIDAAQAAVATAEANVRQRQAELTQARQNSQRVLKLVKDASRGDEAKDTLAAAQARYAAAQSQLKQARQALGARGPENAQLRQARAAVEQARLDLSHTVLTAPAAGTVASLGVRPGAVVQRDMPLFALVENGLWWVEANYKETALGRIRVGEPATITVDMYPNASFKGRVESVSPASGVAFSLLPPENATGNWVKVTQRFPVRVVITSADPDHPLRVGASAEVTIDSTGAKGQKSGASDE